MKNLTIIGRGPSWKDCAFNTGELWASATCLITKELEDKKYTKVFAFDSENETLKQCIAIAKERGIPVVSNREYATESFPTVEIAKEFGSSFFMPTVSYMIAYALYLKYDRIYIYGIDQGPRWDYQAGKSHIMLWIGIALGRKVDLRIGHRSMVWCYRLGLNDLPVTLFEEGTLADRIGLEIREQELAELVRT